MSLAYMALMGGSYIAGALIYGCRFPERYYPGKFNYFVSIFFYKGGYQVIDLCIK
jgi:adiponectin receptor